MDTATTRQTSPSPGEAAELRLRIGAGLLGMRFRSLSGEAINDAAVLRGRYRSL
jgi:hypothetical protein